MRAAQIRAVEIVRPAIDMQIFGELDADAGVPSVVAIGPRGAVSERNIREIENQPVAVRTAVIAVVEIADRGGRAERVVAGAIEVAIVRAADVEITEADAVGVIPDERRVGL